ncbi:hypothetical protein ACJ5NV_05850 [Loktanella agnita]|uniref:hypothetical protein n=1 Tax=Loktanella agnita TaxID=287097 RepID=UPI0039864C71
MNIDFDSWPISRTTAFTHVYGFDTQSLSLLWTRGQSDGDMQPDLAAAALQIWRQLPAAGNICTLAVHGKEYCHVVSSQGNLVIQGTASLNLGLLLPRLVKLPTHPVAAPALPDTTTMQKERTVLWRILERIGCCEIPRRIALDIGGAITIIDAAPCGFNLVEGCRNLTELCDMVCKAVEAGAVVQYSLRDDPANGDMTWQIADFVTAANGAQRNADGGWRFSPDTWPLSCPQDARFDQLNTARGIATACLQGAGKTGATKMTLFGSAGDTLVKIQFRSDETSLTFANSNVATVL